MTNPPVTAPAPNPGAVDYVAGDLRISVGAARLTRNGQEIPLPRLSFDMLLALVREAPNLVTVDDLMKRVWPGLIVSPETVSQRIKLLRVALQDEPRNPRYVAGVRGRGYRMIAPVSIIVPDPPPAAAPPLESPGRVAPARTRFVWPGLAAMVVLVSSVVLWRGHRDDLPAAAPPARSVAVLPFENLSSAPESAALAFGMAETLLHQLAGFKDLIVIARKSSFAMAEGNQDAREIGRKLNARYLLEGSLQRDHTRLRVTAQLIDTTDGSHLWSLQFDRKPADIFAVQDEIATQVAQAMQLTVGGGVRPGVNSSGTQNFDAYLAYSQARARMATMRVADFRTAIGDLERAIRIDPQFVAAYASLARAQMFVAENEVTEERRPNIQQAELVARQLLERARQLDERNADVHFELAMLQEDDAIAESELRRGLELSPNSALGYARLARLLWWSGRRSESMDAIDRARQLDPLEPEYDNVKARNALYARSDLQQAEELSLKVLERNPASAQALMRLGEVYWCCRGRYARGVQYLEQSLQSDPANEFGLRILMRAYLDMADPAEAEAVATIATHSVSVRMVPLLLYQRDWQGAGDRIYDSQRRATGEAIDDALAALAVRMHARSTGDYAAARHFLERRARVTWSSDDTPQQNERFDEEYAVALADILIQVGEDKRAARLLEATLSRYDHEAHQLGRGEMWYLHSKPIALALLGRDADALTVLEQSIAVGFSHDWWMYLQIDPAYERLRSHPRFKALLLQAQKITAEQKLELQDLRERELIPHRTRHKQPSSQ